MRMTPEEAFAFAGFCRNWPAARPDWTARGGDLSDALREPEVGDPFVQLAVFRAGGDADITADQVAEAFGLVAEAFVVLTRRKGMVGDTVQDPQRLAAVFDRYVAASKSDAAEPPAPVQRERPRYVPPARPAAGIVGPKAPAFGGGR